MVESSDAFEVDGAVAASGLTSSAVGDAAATDASLPTDLGKTFRDGGCDAECSIASVCGNQLIEDQEDCDQGVEDTVACNGAEARGEACQVARCGDGYVNETAGEECDSGGVDSAVCNGPGAGQFACRVTTCGDEYVNSAAGEECDDGFAGSVGCNGPSPQPHACRRSVCGDGYANPAAGEDCDDGLDSVGCNGPSGGSFACQYVVCGDWYCNPAAEEVGSCVADCY